MHINVLSIGQKLPDWINQGVEHYLQKIPRHWHCRLIELPAAKRHKSSLTDSLIEQEGERLLQHIQAADYVIAMDVQGKPVDSEGLSDYLAQWQHQGQDLVFLIGGADGLSKPCRQRANLSLSLSACTLPHGLARLVLLEQLYRAWTISANHPYHIGH